jgi:hypothetical protein
MASGTMHLLDAFFWDRAVGREQRGFLSVEQTVLESDPEISSQADHKLRPMKRVGGR